MSNPPVFHGLNLVVRDMEAAIAFYRRLGVTIRDTDPEWMPHHRNMVTPDGVDLDLDSVEFAKQWNRGWPGGSGGNTGVIGFSLASRQSVDDTYADLVTAGYRSQQEPYDAFWGARYAVVEDPDGNAVGLMSPLDDAHRSQPTPP